MSVQLFGLGYFCSAVLVRFFFFFCVFGGVRSLDTGSNLHLVFSCL